MLDYWDLTLDPGGSATLTPARTAEAVTQGFNYDLDIKQFSRPDTLRIARVERDTNHLVVTMHHKHPFDAPADLDAPATAANRADLGYTGRLLVLATSNVATFFTETFNTVEQVGPVQANVGLLANADGYIRPATGLLANNPSGANTFPYKLLVDEDVALNSSTPTGNRISISNFGMPDGNYGRFPTGPGWTRQNIGPLHNEWTGYDFLHQGQTSEIRMEFDLAQVSFSGLSLRLAMLIKYTDPRGGNTPTEKKANRLPSSDGDPLKFAYRLPHAALDVSKITIEGNPEVPVMTGDGRCGLVSLRVRDWDALGTPSLTTSIGNDPEIFSTIPVPAANVPADLNCPNIYFSAPGVMNTAPVIENALASGSGIPGQEGVYEINFRNNLATATTTAGQAAMIRVVDLEDKVPAQSGLTDSYAFGLNPADLSPLSSRPIVEVFHAFTIPIVPTAGPGSGGIGQPQGCPCEGRPGDPYAEPCDSDGLNFGPVTAMFDIEYSASPTSIDWNLGSVATPSTPAGSSVTVSLDGEEGIYVGLVSATNAAGTTAPSPFAFNLGNTYRSIPPVPGWTHHVVDPLAATAAAAQSVDTAVIGGNPYIAYKVGGSGAGQFGPYRLARAITPTPSQPSDWVISDITGTQDGNQRAGVSIVEYSGVPAIAFKDYTVGIGRPSFARALNATPTGPADWVTHPVVPNLGFGIKGYYINLIRKPNGFPAIAYFENTSAPTFNRIYVAQATTTLPTMTSHWTAHVAVENPPPSGLTQSDIRMILLNGNLALGWVEREPNIDVYRTLFSRALTASPTGVGDWSLPHITDMPGSLTGYLDLVAVPGSPSDRPLMVYQGGPDADVMVSAATTATPAGAGDWLVYAIDTPGEVGYEASLTLVGGKPIVAYHNQSLGLMQVAYSLSADPSSSNDWVRQIVDASGPDVGEGNSILVLSDSTTVANASIDGITGALRFSVANGVYP